MNSNDKILNKVILEKVCEMENKGYVYEEAGASLTLLIKEVIGSQLIFFY